MRVPIGFQTYNHNNGYDSKQNSNVNFKANLNTFLEATEVVEKRIGVNLIEKVKKVLDKVGGKNTNIGLCLDGEYDDMAGAMRLRIHNSSLTKENFSKFEYINPTVEMAEKIAKKEPNIMATIKGKILAAENNGFKERLINTEGSVAKLHKLKEDIMQDERLIKIKTYLKIIDSILNKPKSKFSKDFKNIKVNDAGFDKYIS